MHFSTLWKIISFLLSVNMVNSLGLVFVLLFLEHFGIFVKFVTFLLQSSRVSYMHVSSSLLYYTCWNIHVFFCKNFYWSNYALQICSRNSHLLSTYVKLIFSEFETNIQFETNHCAGSNPNVVQICPMDMSWTAWTSWTQCSANCGASDRKRTRSCINGQYGGPKCDIPFEEQRERCNTKVTIKRIIESLQVTSQLV